MRYNKDMCGEQSIPLRYFLPSRVTADVGQSPKIRSCSSLYGKDQLKHRANLIRPFPDAVPIFFAKSVFVQCEILQIFFNFFANNTRI